MSFPHLFRWSRKVMWLAFVPATACSTMESDSSQAGGGYTSLAGSSNSSGGSAGTTGTAAAAGSTALAGASGAAVGGEANDTAGTAGSVTGGAANSGAPGGAGKSGASGGQGNDGSGGRGNGGSGGSLTSGCVGPAWPTADPTAAGPFQVTADKGVGPLAGVTPDPVYGNEQQRFNVYRPKDLGQGGYCHPILVWANGHTDNPEPNPPACVSSKYCGSYLMLMNQLASHGFVVIASLSTITSQGTPLPTIVGLFDQPIQADDRRQRRAL